MLQFVLLIIVLGMPRIYKVNFPFWLRMLGGLILILAGVVVVLGISALGQNLTPFPRPVPDGHLVTSSIYSIVRHPLYTAVIFAIFGSFDRQLA